MTQEKKRCIRRSKTTNVCHSYSYDNRPGLENDNFVDCINDNGFNAKRTVLFDGMATESKETGMTYGAFSDTGKIFHTSNGQGSTLPKFKNIFLSSLFFRLSLCNP